MTDWNDRKGVSGGVSISIKDESCTLTEEEEGMCQQFGILKSYKINTRVPAKDC